MPILSWVPGSSPEAPGTLSFYEQGAAPSSGFQVSSKGAILSAISAAWSGATAAAVVASAIVVGDLFDRWRMTADGGMAWGPGSGARDTTLYRSAAATLATDGSLSLAVAGGGLLIKEGTNARMGLATLVAGTVTVNTTAVTANSRIQLTAQSTGAAPGACRISARTPGTSFVISSTSGTDTSTVAWQIVEPAP